MYSWMCPECDVWLEPAGVTKVAPVRKQAAAQKIPERENPEHYHKPSSRDTAFKNYKKEATWRTPEVDELWSATSSFPRGNVLCVIGVLITINSICSEVQDQLNGMHMAWELEAPLPTRSEYAEVPVVGRAFQLACDLGDVIRVNYGFLSKYAPSLPRVAMTPVVAVAAPKALGPAIQGVYLTKAAVVSLIPLIPLTR